MLYLLHHINFQVTTIVHLVQIARDYVTNAQVTIISDILFGFSTLGKLFLGSALSKNSRLARRNILAFQKLNFRISRLGRARSFRVIRVVNNVFCRRVRSWHRNIRSRFRRWLMSGAVGNG